MDDFSILHAVRGALPSLVDSSSDLSGEQHMKLSSRFEQALQYAFVAHAGQMRKASGVPYVAHLLGVASIALEYGANKDEAIGALLHDAAEDAGGRGRLDDIRQKFGEAVADIVEGCTDTFETPKPE